MKVHMRRWLKVSIYSLILCNLATIAQATDLADARVLLLNNSQILMTLPGENLILHGTGDTVEGYSTFELRAWDLYHDRAACAEAAGGTGDTCRSADDGFNGPIVDEASSGTGDSIIGGSNAPIGTNTPLPVWGYAEVLHSCFRTDIVVYQHVEQKAVEFATTTFTTDRC